MATVVRDDRSIGHLLRDLTHELTTLLRQEIALAKAEVTEAAARLGGSAGELVVGGAVVFAAALVLLAAVVLAVAALLYRWLPAATANWLAPLAVGAVLAVIGLVKMRRALGKLKHIDLTPRKTTRSLQENKAWLQSRIQ
jgi:uncharacterized membrane protein YqjE